MGIENKPWYNGGGRVWRGVPPPPSHGRELLNFLALNGASGGILQCVIEAQNILGAIFARERSDRAVDGVEGVSPSQGGGGAFSFF